jgi:hypothetical protein
MQGRTQNFFFFFGGGGGVQQIKVTEGRENRERGGGSPLVRGSAKFANGWNPYSY